MCAIRNAFVLGAGLGTRLKSLTERLPKPLIPVCNKPLITFAFDRLLHAGVTKLIVNTHHCPGAYVRIFPDAKYDGTPVHFSHEPDLLETAGGIKNVEPLLGGEPFVVYNGDILSDLPVERAVRHHLDSGNEVTLALRSSDGPLSVSLDESNGRITDISKRLLPDLAPKYLFTGIYVVSPEFFARIPARTKISVIPIFMEMIRRGEKLGGIVIDEGCWWDLGTREQYLAVHRHFAECEKTGGADYAGLDRIHPTAKIASSAKISAATAIGARAVIGENVSLKNCILWENSEIAPGAELENCIVTAGRRVEGAHADSDF